MKPEETAALLEQLQQEWNILDIVHFNELSIPSQLSHLPYTLMKYQNQYLIEKARMDELMEIKDRVVGKLYDKLKFNSDKALTGREIENYYIPVDADVLKVNGAIDKQKIVIEYFEMCIKAINQMNWAIKSYIEDRRYTG